MLYIDKAGTSPEADKIPSELRENGSEATRTVLETASRKSVRQRDVRRSGHNR